VPGQGTGGGRFPGGFSCIVHGGGNPILSGDVLFTQHQPFWNPRVVWSNAIVRVTTPDDWANDRYPARTCAKGFQIQDLTQFPPVGAGVNAGTGLAGSST
jgi:serine protease AprX